MSALQDIRKMSVYVKDLLIKFPHLRDNHDALTSNVWFYELERLRLPSRQITAFDLLQLIAKGKLTSEETIQRARRKIQREYAELRGKKYDERMEEEREVRQNINR